MAWNTVLPLMVRHLVGDLGVTESYTDERLATAVTIAAILVQQEYSFDTTYIVDVEAPCLEPDPTETATLDYQAMALFTLKAACIIIGGSYHTAIKSGVKVDDWNTSIDTRPRIDGYKDIIASGPCKAYNELLTIMTWDNKSGKGRAVFGPYSESNNLFITNGRYDVINFFNSMFY